MTAKLMAIVRQHSNIGSPFGSPGGGQEREGSLLSKVQKCACSGTAGSSIRPARTCKRIDMTVRVPDSAGSQ